MVLQHRVLEARIYVRALDMRIRAKESSNGIAVRQHADYLMQRNTRALYASLSVTNARVNCDTIEHLTSSPAV